MADQPTSERHCIKCGNPERLHGPKPDPAVDDGFGGESWYHWHPFSPAPEQGEIMTEMEQSLNNTISTLLAERYALRQLAIKLRAYAVDVAPYNPYGEARIAEDSKRRRELIQEANELLDCTATVKDVCGHARH